MSLIKSWNCYCRIGTTSISVMKTYSFLYCYVCFKTLLWERLPISLHNHSVSDQLTSNDFFSLPRRREHELTRNRTKRNGSTINVFLSFSSPLRHFSSDSLLPELPFSLQTASLGSRLPSGNKFEEVSRETGRWKHLLIPCHQSNLRWVRAVSRKYALCFLLRQVDLPPNLNLFSGASQNRKCLSHRSSNPSFKHWRKYLLLLETFRNLSETSRCWWC